MDLSGRKSHMKDGSDDLEGDLPSRPEAPEEVHGDDCLARGSRRRCVMQDRRKTRLRKTCLFGKTQ